jgi:tetratricopeptide (TPR) repeat protein
LSQNTKALHFGTGSPAIRRVRILWPSGQSQEFANLEAGFRYEIEEGSSEWRRTPFAPRRDYPQYPPVLADNRPLSADTWLFDPVPLPVPRSGPGILRLTAEDLGKQPEEVAAAFALFRRYLFDWRTDLDLPCALLLDDRGMVRKFYARLPGARQVSEDLTRLAEHSRLALPFPGRYYSRPSRNYFRLGAAFLNSGYPEQTLPYLNETLRRSPDNAMALLAVSQVYLETGRQLEARQLLERALALRPDSAEGWNNLGGVEMAAGDTRAALRAYEKALAIRPKMTHALLNAAEAYAQGRGNEARDWFQRAIAVRRDFSGAINNLGVLYMQIEQPNDAIAAFQYGVEVAPQEDILYVNLAKVYARLGEREKAKAVIQRLLELKPEHEAARRALQELEKP